MDDYKVKIINWLEQKWPAFVRRCEICNAVNQWSISEDIVSPIIFKNNGFNLGDKAYPQIMVICSNCGNTKYFNVALMDVLKSKGIDGK